MVDEGFLVEIVWWILAKEEVRRAPECRGVAKAAVRKGDDFVMFDEVLLNW